MKSLHFLYILIVALLLSSCHSHSKVVRPDGGKVVVNPGKQPSSRPSAKGDADNNYTKALLDEAYAWIGTPYKYGGTDRSGADCSGFVMVVYNKTLGIKLPRVSREQGDFCQKIKKSDLFPGDLVFFHTGNSSKVNHVGIYVGDGKMIHASTKGIMVSDLSHKYYIDHYSFCGRIPQYHQLIKKKK